MVRLWNGPSHSYGFCYDGPCKNHPKSEQNSSDFEWFGCGMVHHIAMAFAMMDHSKTKPFQIRTIFVPFLNGIWYSEFSFQVVPVFNKCVKSIISFSFNMICLPEHDNFPDFEKALLTAITEGSEGFGFA